MGESLEQLEENRKKLYQQMASLNDFHPGTISANYPYFPYSMPKK